MYPALGSSIPLVNDLDLTVSNGTHVFYPYSPYTDTHQQVDRLNNVELILLPTPLTNITYTITVTAYQLSTDQSYALVMTGDIARTVLMKRASFPSNSSTLLTTFPLTVTIFLLIVIVTFFIVSVYSLLKLHSDYVTEKRYLTQKPATAQEEVEEPKLSSAVRESNLRSFSERYDQFPGSNFPPAPTPHSSNRKSRRSREFSQSSNGSILNGHDLSEMYPSPPPRISQSISPYVMARQSTSQIDSGYPFPSRKSSSKTCSKDLLLYYSQQQHTHLHRHQQPSLSPSPPRTNSQYSNKRKSKSHLSKDKEKNENVNISSTLSVSSTEAVAARTV
jgi:hypothetical protein